MVSRSLTEVFVLMRNNAIHSRQLFSEQNESERVRLMRSNSNDMEAGMEIRSENAPPPWTDALEEAHYIITRLRTKLSELQSCHSRQIRRPALDDTGEQEHIGRLTTEIGRHFTHAYTHLTAIKAQVRHGNKTEQKLATNVVLALVTTLQELSVTFRTAQSNYLKSLTSREERSNAYFDLPNFEELSLEDDNLLPDLTNNQTDLLFSLPSTSGTQKNNFIDDYEQQADFEKPSLNQKQLLLMQEENTRMVAEREQEVNKIVRSIVDLNEIFKDLGHMVHEQGTILDRIDYNIEATQVQVQEGYKQLQKAERYQRKNRKMHCILVLAVMIIILVVLLIIVKS
ncbi:syntaxin-16 [Leguminivora glycinivorella]|uniref:syntaxin-16 n=1 Tax=Leguminivora glycinivorella TaxID=1035111 RepID=UPI00200E84F9|nr:syntaxin-16 [Leguminivora glycinivorella]